MDDLITDQNTSGNAYFLISNALDHPSDEGIKKFASIFSKVLEDKIGKRLFALPIHTSDGAMKRKLFLSQAIRRNIRSFDPDYIFYIPTSSASLASFMRCGVLQFMSDKKCKLVMITLQPSYLSSLGEIVARSFAPDLVLTQSETALQYLSLRGIHTERIHAGVDVKTFLPVTGHERVNLRKKYNIPVDRFIALHVGHISPLRNLDAFIKLKRGLDFEVLIVGSTSTKADQKVLEELSLHGMRVMIDYIPAIQELYQLADSYVFPTKHELGAIGVPLSVLEAMACNLPVITTRFGQLPTLFDGGDGLVYADTDEEFLIAMKRVMDLQQVDTRLKVMKFSWDAVVDDILEKTKCIA